MPSETPRPRLLFPAALLNNQRKSIDQLTGLCHGILADGIVTDAEARTFRAWVHELHTQSPAWPLDVLAQRCNKIFADGIVTEEERADLADIMRQLTGATDHIPDTGKMVTPSTELPLDTPPPAITFAGKEFVVTGKFIHGARSAVHDAIATRGGLIGDNPRHSTDYLVIGALASTAWAHTSYGRKIERAVELRANGAALRIVSEEHWQTSLNN